MKYNIQEISNQKGIRRLMEVLFNKHQEPVCLQTKHISIHSGPPQPYTYNYMYFLEATQHVQVAAINYFKPFSGVFNLKMTVT
jgi:hypothetical protein